MPFGPPSRSSTQTKVPMLLVISSFFDVLEYRKTEQNAATNAAKKNDNVNILTPNRNSNRTNSITLILTLTPTLTPNP